MPASAIPAIFFKGWFWIAIMAVILVIQFFFGKTPSPPPKPPKFLIKHQKSINKITDFFVILIVLLYLYFLLKYPVYMIYETLSESEPLRTINIKFALTILFVNMIIVSGISATLLGLSSFFQTNLTIAKRIVLLILSILAPVFTIIVFLFEKPEEPLTLIQMSFIFSFESWIVNAPAIITGKSFYSTIWSVYKYLRLVSPTVNSENWFDYQSTFAAVMTGKGVGAISTIQVYGGGAQAVLEKVFKSAGSGPATFETGKIILGSICDGPQIIDQVTLGCEGSKGFAIHCHGNPLIVSDIMKLLGENNVELINPEQLLKKIFSADSDINSIALEAKLAIPKAKTLQGTKLINNQISLGLNKTVKHWLDNIDQIGTGQIKYEAEQILKKTEAAKALIDGLKIAIVGPPNTGKSTLLNYLAGKQKAIVTDIKGTTRDYVSAECRIGSLFAELIDTAGLDQSLSEQLDRQGQEKAAIILQQADMLLLVLDISQAMDQFDKELLDKVGGKKIITVFNKSDLQAVLEQEQLPEPLRNCIKISATSGRGIKNLIENIERTTIPANFDVRSAVCFTDRQRDLLSRIKAAGSRKDVISLITELLNGSIGV